MLIGEKIAIRGQGGEVVNLDPRVDHYKSFELQTHYQPGVEKPASPTRTPVIRTSDLS